MHESSEPDNPDMFAWHMDGEPSDGPNDEPLHDPTAVDEAFLRPVEDTDTPDVAHEIIDGTTSEIIESPAEQVRARCLQEVDAVIEMVESDVRARRQPCHNVVRILSDKVTLAAEAADLATIDRHITMLAAYGQVTMPTATAYYTATLAGSDCAPALLQEALEAERAARPERIAARAVQSPEYARFAMTSLVLSSIIHACQENGIDAGPWIDMYALDGEDHWKLSAAHYANGMRSTEGEARNTYAVQLNAKAAALFEDGAFTPEFICDNTWSALQYASDPAVRTGLIDKYKSVVGGAESFGWSDFQEVMMIGDAMLRDEVLATPENRAYFARTIDDLSALFQRAGFDVYDIINTRLSWDMALIRSRGASPQEIVEAHDLRVGSLMASNISDGPDGTTSSEFRNRETVAVMRDRRLGMYAEAAMKENAVDEAAYYLSVIGNQWVKTDMLQKCLFYIQTVEQLEAIMPTDELALAFDPNLAVQLLLVKARLAGDTIALRRLGLHQVPNLLEDRSFVTRKYIQSTYEATVAVNDAQAVDLAKELLPLLRAIGEGYSKTEYLSNALIAAGDTNEPQHAYEIIHDICRNDEPTRLALLWDLAQKIEAARVAADS
jgi:hypothetical protein